jgi:branched-subunit amino acid aminotransferase/4-amino-4-deoxychorismate lyase
LARCTVRLFATRDHLDRLERSASRIGLRVPPRAEIEAAIAETVAAAGKSRDARAGDADPGRGQAGIWIRRAATTAAWS